MGQKHVNQICIALGRPFPSHFVFILLHKLTKPISFLFVFVSASLNGLLGRIVNSWIGVMLGQVNK